MSAGSHTHQAEPSSVIARGWQSFERETINPAAGAAQRRDMRTCFHAGSLVVLNELANAINGGCSAQAVEARIHAMSVEILTCVATLYAGRGQAPHTPTPH